MKSSLCILVSTLATIQLTSAVSTFDCRALCRNGSSSSCPAECLTSISPVHLVARQFQGRRRPQNTANKGADVKNNQVSAQQDTADTKANTAAASGATTAAVGGIGGVDPATGETLLALPAESSFCSGSGQKAADGTQITAGFCSSIPQGQIPAVEKMVSTLIVSPENNANIAVGAGFTVSIQTANLQTGFFTAAATEYYTQPQTLNAQGIIKGHQHVTIQMLTSTTEAPDANVKQFFKGLNDAASADGVLSVDVPAGTLTAAGLYRICTISGAFSHQPTVMPIAQRGAQDDCIRVNVGGNGSGNDNGNGNGNGNGNDATSTSTSAASAATSSAPAAAQTTPAAAAGRGGRGGRRGGRGRGN